MTFIYWLLVYFCCRMGSFGSVTYHAGIAGWLFFVCTHSQMKTVFQKLTTLSITRPIKINNWNPIWRIPQLCKFNLEFDPRLRYDYCKAFTKLVVGHMEVDFDLSYVELQFRNPPLLIFFDNCMYSTYAIFFYLLQNSFLYDKECRNRIWRKLLSSKNQWCNQMGMKWNWFFPLFINYKKLAMNQVIIGIVRCIRVTFKIQLLLYRTQKSITPKLRI